MCLLYQITSEPVSFNIIKIKSFPTGSFSVHYRSGCYTSFFTSATMLFTGKDCLGKAVDQYIKTYAPKCQEQ
jgi:hypothetical protein